MFPELKELEEVAGESFLEEVLFPFFQEPL